MPAAPPARAERAAAPPRARASLVTDGLELLERIDRAQFPATLYVEGPDEPLKATFLAELRHAWALSCPEAPAARVFRAAECGVDEVLAVFHGSSLFCPRELVMLLEVEDFGRSEKRVLALAEGMTRPAGGSCLVLVESAADSARKSLDPLRAACAVRWIAMPLARAGLLAWGCRRLARERITAERGLLEALTDACEGDPASYFNELEKLTSCASPGGKLTLADAAALMRPAPGADLPDFLGAVALGHAAVASRRLGRLLATGVSEGMVLFALANLVGGALGGWARYRDLSMALRRRAAPRELARTLDAIYRAEAAWKGGQADPVAVLEQVTREACGVSV
jgi:DNA polymerase III delta subunit